MRIFDGQPGGRAGIALCLLSMPVAAAAQVTAHPSSADPDDEDHPPLPSAYVFAEPQLRGDLRLLVNAANFPQRPDLVAIIRKSLHCDWRPQYVGKRVAQGTCRRLLRSDRGAVSGTLDLAPLASGLRQAGASVVRFNLAATGEPVESAGRLPWTAGTVGKTADSGMMMDIRNWQSVAVAGYGPAPFRVRFGSPWSFSHMAVPLVFVLCGPAALALWFRRRMQRLGSSPGTGAVTLNWVLLGAWLYWISVVGLEDLTGFSARLDTDQWLVTLFAGALLFAAPPLVATAACLLALLPGANPEGDGPRCQVPRMVWVGVAQQAVFAVPLGLFLMGTALVMEEFRAGLFSLIAAYAAFRAIAWSVWRWNSPRIRSLDGGELRARAAAIAQTAKVDLKTVHLLENRSPAEANAFAAAGGRISFTRSLLENLTRREVDAVIGHEVGHLRGKHIGARLGFFLGYIFVVGPAISHLVIRAGLPPWILTLPVVPLLYVLASSWLAQRQELSADARAVQLTNDPEGSIAALARLAQLTRSPIDWGGIQGSILSHPSMRRRVLALARRFGVAEERALAILKNPDVLEGGAGERYPLPQDIRDRPPVFTSTERMTHGYWGNWVFGGVLTGLLLACDFLVTKAAPFPRSLPAFAATLPAAWWLTLMFDKWWDRRFLRKMRRAIQAHRAIPEDGIFVGLLPGGRVVAFESVYAWDLGVLALEAGQLTFEGENTRFSVPRDKVEAIEIRRGPLQWLPVYAVVVRCASATFSLNLADRGLSRRRARQLEKRLRVWWKGEPPEAAAACAEAPAAPQSPDLDDTPRHTPSPLPSRLATAWYFAKTSVFIFIGAFLTSGVMMGVSHMAAVPLAAAVLYLATVSPALLRRAS